MLDGRLRHLPGGVEEYLRLRRRAEAAATPPPPAATSAPRGGTDSARSRQDRKEVARLERQIERLTDREGELERAMVEAATDPARLLLLAEEHAQVVVEREALEERWLELAD